MVVGFLGWAAVAAEQESRQAEWPILRPSQTGVPSPGPATVAAVDSESVVHRLIEHGNALLCKIGSFFQRRLWDALRQNFSRGRAGHREEDNPAVFLLKGVPLLNVATQQRVLPLSGSQKTLSADEKRVASAALLISGHLSGFMLRTSADAARHNGWRVLALLKKRRYDETPTRISLRESSSSSSTRVVGKPSAVSETAKVFQTEVCAALLLAHAPSRRSFLMRVSLPTLTSVVDTASAENIKALQQEAENLIAGMSDLQPELTISCPVTDRAAANIRAEKDMSSQSSSSVNCHCMCKIHKASQVQSVQFRHTDVHVSGMLHCALAQRGGGHRKALRKLLMDIIEERLSIRLGDPPDSFACHREAVLDLFLSGNFNQHGKLPEKRVRIQRAILTYFFRGDLQNEQEIEFWSPRPIRRGGGLVIVQTLGSANACAVGLPGISEITLGRR